MKSPETFSLGLASGLAAVAIGLTAVPAASAPATPPAAAKKAAAKPTAPPTAPSTGWGTLNGVWNDPAFKTTRSGPPVGAERGLPTADGKPVPYQDWALKVVEERRKAAAEGRPLSEKGACLPNGMPAMMRPPIQLPIQFVETPDQKQITVLFEFYGTFRIIRMNEKLPADPDPSFMGHSVGRWEGKTLVVETIAISDKVLIGNVPHGPDAKLVERIRRVDADTLENRVTVTDPKTFTRPFTWVITLKRIPGMRVQEYVCENERNAADENGVTSVKLQTSSAS